MRMTGKGCMDCGAALASARIRCKPCQAAYMREYRKKNKGDPLKHRARSSLKYHQSTGRVRKRPCEVCGDPNSQAHHRDYNSPLDVIWLCKPHHLAWHAYLRRFAGRIFQKWLITARLKMFAAVNEPTMPEISRRPQ